MTPPAADPSTPSAEASAIEAYLVDLVAKQLRVPSSQVDPTALIETLGLDSLGAVDVVESLQRHLKRPVPTLVLTKYPTLRALAVGLAEKK